MRSPWASRGCQSSTPRRELCPGPSQPAQRYPGTATIRELQSCLWSPLSCPDVCPDSSLSCPHPTPGGLLAQSPPGPALTAAASPTDTPLPPPAHPLEGSSPVLPTIRAPDLGLVLTPATAYIRQVGFCLRAWRSRPCPIPFPWLVQPQLLTRLPAASVPGSLFKWKVFLFLIFIDLFGALLGLRCCVWPSSSCREWGPLSSWGAQASHCRGISCCRAWAPGARGPPSLGLTGSGGSAQQLWHMGLVAPGHVLLEPGIEPMSLALQGALLNHWTAREALQT